VRLPCPIAELARQARSNEESAQQSFMVVLLARFTSRAAKEVRSGR
jgi:hypothetical protein